MATLTKMVNGISVSMTDEEEANIKAEWDANAKKAEAKQLEVEANMWKTDRIKAYPSVQDQLDMIYHDKIDGTNKWVDAITAIKLQYPNPTEIVVDPISEEVVK